MRVDAGMGKVKAKQESNVRAVSGVFDNERTALVLTEVGEYCILMSI
jgi:hypothetical protein